MKEYKTNGLDKMTPRVSELRKKLIFNDYENIDLESFLCSQFFVTLDANEQIPMTQGSWRLGTFKPNHQGIETKGLIIKIIDEIHSPGYSIV